MFRIRSVRAKCYNCGHIIPLVSSNYKWAKKNEFCKECGIQNTGAFEEKGDTNRWVTRWQVVPCYWDWRTFRWVENNPKTKGLEGNKIKKNKHNYKLKRVK